MAVQTLPYKSLNSLIKDYLFAYTKDRNTKSLITEFAKARRRGYLTKAELKQVIRNRPFAVRDVTRSAFSCTSELDKIQTLVALHGVGIPMASAILMLTDPRRYAVIDIRVWQLLHAMKAVEANHRGVNLNPSQWVEFLEIAQAHVESKREGSIRIEDGGLEIENRG
jgi:hypothetical protein